MNEKLKLFDRDIFAPYIPEINKAIELYKSLGLNNNIPEDLLCKNRSHAPKWHACSITEHVRWCAGIAIYFIASGRCPTELFEIACYHDIGKVVAPQITLTDVTFHDHAACGADYLAAQNMLPAKMTDIIRNHGTHRKTNYDRNTDMLLLQLDMCDEFSKWSIRRFPPNGTKKQVIRRLESVNRLRQAGMDESMIEEAELVPDEIADQIRLICDDKIERMDLDVLSREAKKQSVQSDRQV